MAVTDLLYRRYAGNSRTGALDQVQASWVAWGIRALRARQEAYESYQEYYDGDHELAFSTDKWDQVFEEEFEEMADNWCGVVVDSAAQRLEIDGWDCEDDKSAIKRAEQIWDDNCLGIDADAVHTQAFIKGDSFLMCWPDETGTKQEGVDVYYNDALDLQVYYNPADRREITHAVKKWVTEDGRFHLRIYYADRIEAYIASDQVYVSPDQFIAGWSPDDADTALSRPLPEGWEWEAAPIPNKYGVVPAFHFRNRGIGRTHGMSELKPVIPLQNAVNKLFMDLMVASEFGSYRQKWVAGGGQPEGGFKSGAFRMWASTDAATKFGEFGQTDLEPYNRVIEMVVGHIAKITSTPMHYLRTSGDMPSGEALKTAESGLVHKCQSRQKEWGDPWSKAMTFALSLNGDKPKSPVYPVWKSAETRHDLEQAQTAQLKAILGIPLEQIWREHFNYPEEQIAEFKKTNQNVFASLLQAVLAQSGQLPPGLQGPLEDAGVQGAGGLPAPQLSLPQLLAQLPKGITSQTPGGEASTKVQANTRPPASPTRRSSGFKD